MVGYPGGPSHLPEQRPIVPYDGPTPPSSLPPTTRGRTKWFVAAAAVVAVLSLAGAATGIVTARDARHIMSSTPTTSSSTALQQLQQWWSAARDDFTDMKNASEDVQHAMEVFTPGGLAAGCQRVHDAAAVRLQSHLPAPDSELTAELQAAIEDYHSAAHMCLAVAAGSTVNYDAEFMSSMAQANRHMKAAQDIILKTLTIV